MIFYFSGTGNSQLVAREMAKVIGDEVISINQCLKEGKKNTFQSERPLVFVTPTYAWRIPKVVESWISKTRFEGNNKAYFVLTCGGNSGNAAAYAKKLCMEKGLEFCGLNQVVMPENYIAMFQVPSQPECKVLLEKAVPSVKAFAMEIQKEKHFLEAPMSLKDKLLSGPVNLLYYPLMVHDKGFTVSEDCVSCKKCAKRCPLNNIEMKDGKPVWKGNCTHCMACIGGCPTEAIEYKKASKGKRRYYIMEE